MIYEITPEHSDPDVQELINRICKFCGKDLFEPQVFFTIVDEECFQLCKDKDLTYRVFNFLRVHVTDYMVDKQIIEYIGEKIRVNL